MENITIAEAKEQLEELIERARRGEEVRISGGSGAVRLEPVDAGTIVRPKRVFGQWRDKFEVPARLFEPLSEDELHWIGGEGSP